MESATWLRSLPHSIEAMFMVDCAHNARNTPYSASRTCDAAHERARRVHAAFTAQYGLSASKFPLLRLSPGEWDAPFAAAD